MDLKEKVNFEKNQEVFIITWKFQENLRTGVLQDDKPNRKTGKGGGEDLIELVKK